MEPDKQASKVAASQLPVVPVPTALQAAGSAMEHNGAHARAVSVGRALGHLKDLCEVKLCLDEVTQRRALQLFQSTESLMAGYFNSATNGEELERLWTACILHAVKKLSQGTTVGGDVVQGVAAGFTLSQLLRYSNVTLVDFFNELGSFVMRAEQVLANQFGADAEQRLQVKELQANFVNSTILFTHYKKSFAEYFVVPGESPGGLPAKGAGTTKAAPATPTRGAPSAANKHLRLGWLLFLVIRARLLPQYADLVTSGNALICTIHILLLHVPANLRRFSFAESAAKFTRRANVGVDLLGSLCEQYKAAEDNVAALMDQVHSLLGQLLGRPASLQAQRTRSSGEQLGGLDTHARGFGIFDSLMDGPGLEASIRKVEKAYEEALQSHGDIDERVFLEGESEKTLGSPSPLTPLTKMRLGGGGSGAIASPQRSTHLSSPAKFASSPPRFAASSPYSSPVRATLPLKGAPGTPMTNAMTTALWLRQVIAPLQAELSPQGKGLLQGSSDTDMLEQVRARAERVLEGTFPAWADDPPGGAGGVLNQAWAEERRLESSKLYWRLLGAMLTNEAQRLEQRDFSRFLGNECFHRSLLACCAEIVLASHKATMMAFPAVLVPAGITAFDLAKVIEHVVRAEETLPREIKRHLNNVEERILESMAWEKGSSLYATYVAVRKPKGAATDAGIEEIHRLRLLPEMAIPLPEVAPPGGQEDAPQSPTTLQGSPDAGGGASSPFRKEGGGLRPSVGSAFSPIRPTPRPLPALPPAFATPSRPALSRRGGDAQGGVEDTCGGTVLSVFFQKVMKLVAIRVRAIGERLHLPAAVLEQVYKVMQHALVKESSLFFCRHVDQPMLCSIYGVCKVSKVDVTFKTIIEAYRKMPHCKPDVIRNVIIHHEHPPTRPRAECADIIKFYNGVFVPRVKQVLFDLAKGASPSQVAASRASPADASTAAVTSAPPPDTAGAAAGPAPPASPERTGIVPPQKGESSPFRALPNVSPKKFGKHVYVSPLRPHRAEALMSTGLHARSLFASVGEASQPFQSPSRCFSAINERLNSTRSRATLGRLKFDDDDDSKATSSGSGASAPAPSRSAKQNGFHDSVGQRSPAPSSPSSKRMRTER